MDRTVITFPEVGQLTSTKEPVLRRFVETGQLVVIAHGPRGNLFLPIENLQAFIASRHSDPTVRERAPEPRRTLTTAEKRQADRLLIRTYSERWVGKRNPQYRLSDSDIAAIKRLSERGIRQVDIATMFHTSQKHVSQIVTGKIRKAALKPRTKAGTVGTFLQDRWLFTISEAALELGIPDLKVKDLIDAGRMGFVDWSLDTTRAKPSGIRIPVDEVERVKSGRRRGRVPAFLKIQTFPL